MILDNEGIFSDKQQLLSSAASTNIIDLGAPGVVVGNTAPVKIDLAWGTKIPLLVQVVEEFADLTSLAIALQASDDPTFATSTTLYTQTIPLAQLKVGARWALNTVPYGAKQRYLRLNYT